MLVNILAQGTQEVLLYSSTNLAIPSRMKRLLITYLLISLPAYALHSCIGGCLWRSGPDLHQFDRITIRIIDPVLQIGIHPLGRGSTDLKASCRQLTESSRQIINQQAN